MPAATVFARRRTPPVVVSRRTPRVVVPVDRARARASTRRSANAFRYASPFIQRSRCREIPARARPEILRELFPRIVAGVRWRRATAWRSRPRRRPPEVFPSPRPPRRSSMTSQRTRARKLGRPSPSRPPRLTRTRTRTNLVPRRRHRNAARTRRLTTRRRPQPRSNPISWS